MHLKYLLKFFLLQNAAFDLMKNGLHVARDPNVRSRLENFFNRG
jgi:hypothetical protein